MLRVVLKPNYCYNNAENRIQSVHHQAPLSSVLSLPYLLCLVSCQNLWLTGDWVTYFLSCLGVPRSFFFYLQENTVGKYKSIKIHLNLFLDLSTKRLCQQGNHLRGFLLLSRVKERCSKQLSWYLIRCKLELKVKLTLMDSVWYTAHVSHKSCSTCVLFIFHFASC